MSVDLCQLTCVISPATKLNYGGYMIRIDKAEAAYLRERFPDVTITRTMKQRSKRHRYYVEESRKVLGALDKYRRGGVR